MKDSERPTAHGTASTVDANVDELMREIRDANERLVLTVLDALSVLDRTPNATEHAREELVYVTDHIHSAVDILAKAAGHAKAVARDAQQREDKYRELSARLLRLQDEERRRVALDLHDSTAQYLAALAMNLDLVEKGAAALDTQAYGALARSRSLAEQCFEEVRALAYQLHPPLIDEAGLHSALRWYVAGFAERSGIQVDLRCDDLGRLPAAIEVALFRVVQESLNNVHRHSSSPTASICLRNLRDMIALEVRDQGHGMIDEHDSEICGSLDLGIQGMHERVCQLGGTCDIESTDRGTIVRASIPLPTGTE